jgi:hypothetical protein
MFKKPEKSNFSTIELMSLKNTLPYFAYQSVIYAKSIAHFKEIWSYYPDWKRSLQPSNSSISDESAWVNYKALDFLKSYLKPEHKVYEFGGGGSTLFFCKRVSEVFTVENDPDWFEILKKQVETKQYPAKWSGSMIVGKPIAPNPNRRIDNPADFKSNHIGQADLNYQEYAQSIKRFPAEYFDVVLVDGRVRPSCIQESLSHIKVGGYLVVDNMERGYYWTAFEEVFRDNFEYDSIKKYPLPYHHGFIYTVVFKKKKSF